MHPPALQTIRSKDFKDGACRRCGCADGYITKTNGQNVLRCSECEAFDHNVSKATTGEPQRSVRSRQDTKPSERARILERHGHACVGCGRMSPEVVLHIDHLIPVDAARKAGLYDEPADVELIEAEINKAPMCEECNLGASGTIDTKSIRLMYRVLLLKSAK